MDCNISRIVLDYEGYRGCDNQLIVKELSILDVNSNKLLCLTFKPSEDDKWYNLDKSIKSTNNFIKDKIHGIPYDYGHCEYSELSTILKDTTKHPCILYSKGSEKCTLFKKITGKNVYDINRFTKSVKCECDFESVISKSHVKCFHPHGENYNHCALRKAYYYKHLVLCRIKCMYNNIDKITQQMADLAI